LTPLWRFSNLRAWKILDCFGESMVWLFVIAAIVVVVLAFYHVRDRMVRSNFNQPSDTPPAMAQETIQTSPTPSAIGQRVIREPVKQNDFWKMDNKVCGIDSIEFSGECSESPKGVYVLACGTLGYTNNKEEHILLEQGRIILRRQLAGVRYVGVVADDGAFVIEQFASDQSSPSSLHAFAKSGKQLWTRRFQTGVLHHAISQNGNYYVWHSFPSKQRRIETIGFVDLSVGQSKFERDVSGNFYVLKYEIDTERQIIIANCKNDKKVIYGFDGKILGEQIARKPL
jgi:hypothetical protein